MEKWAKFSLLFCSFCVVHFHRFDHFLRFNFKIWRKSRCHWVGWDECSLCACLRVHASERSRERKMLLNIYYKHWTIRQFDVDDFSFGRSYSGQVWNHKWNIRLVYFSVWFHEYKNNLPNPWLFKWSCFMLCACMRVRALVFSCCNILNYVRLLLGRLQNFMWAYKVLPILLFFLRQMGCFLTTYICEWKRIRKRTKWLTVKRERVCWTDLASFGGKLRPITVFCNRIRVHITRSHKLLIIL